MFAADRVHVRRQVAQVDEPIIDPREDVIPKLAVRGVVDGPDGDRRLAEVTPLRGDAMQGLLGCCMNRHLGERGGGAGPRHGIVARKIEGILVWGDGIPRSDS